MIEDILRRFEAEPGEVTMVGDSLRDLQAASAMRCKPILVLTGKGRKTLKAGGLPAESLVRRPRRGRGRTRALTHAAELAR